MLGRIKCDAGGLIKADVNVFEIYGISRSLHRKATTQARNNGLKKEDVNIANRWRSVERAKGIKW
jgi:hypothetical protein